MKKLTLSVIAIILVVISIFSFSACSKTLTSEDGYKALDAAVKFSTEKVQKDELYYSHVIKYDARRKTVIDERFLNVAPDDKSTTNIDEFRAHYYRVDSSNLKETKYFDEFFGASLPSTAKKNPTAEQYKTYFFDEIIKIVNEEEKPIDEYTKKEMTKAEFLSKNNIYDLTALNIIALVKNINSSNSKIISAVQTGHVTELLITLNADVRSPEDSNLVDLYSLQGKDDAIVVRILDNKIDKVAVVKVVNGKIDNNSNALLTYFLTYVGPNLKFFGAGNMPNYDKCNDAK